MSDVSGSRSVEAFRTMQNVFIRFFPIAALAVFGGLFVQHLLALDWDILRQAALGIAPWQWIASLVLTGLSFAALGTYDVLVHRVLGTGTPPRLARSAGIKAIAVAQTLGFGAVTGAFVRWRCLPDLSAVAVARLSAVVSVTFLAALAVIGALVVPWTGLIQNTAALLSGAVLAVVGILTLAGLAHRLGWMPRALDRQAMLALLVATFVDTAAAAGALWVLWPEAISFHLIFAAYLIALGAGLVSNAPGGLGAFDLTLLALIPTGATEPATCAVLAFRLTYYVIPTAIALLFLIRPKTPEPMVLDTHPEGALALQSATIKHHAGTPHLALPTFAGPVVLAGGTDLQRSNRLPQLAIYKADAQTAAAARRQGHSVLRCAQEAIIELHSWSLDGPKRRQLRRALKSFGTSGVVIAAHHDPSSLAPIAKEWADHHGQERGLSMGQFDPAYLTHQRVFAAYKRGRPIAFVSFHTTGGRWTLDLVRHGKELPKGTMQALICAAIDAARAEGIATLSLAAVPDPEPHLPFARKTLETAKGLHRFKEAFAPTWEPRYLCAKGPVRLAITALALTHGIHYPRFSSSAAGTKAPHLDNEDISFATGSKPCDAPISP